MGNANGSTMIVDTQTGYLTPTNYHAVSGLTPQRKQAFLEAYAHTGNFSASARAIGFSRRQIYEVLELDSAWKADFQEVQNALLDTLESVMVINGQRPSGFMDRIAYLKAHRPEKWNDRRNVQYSVDPSMIEALKAASSMYTPRKISNPDGELNQAQSQDV